MNWKLNKSKVLILTTVFTLTGGGIYWYRTQYDEKIISRQLNAGNTVDPNTAVVTEGRNQGDSDQKQVESALLSTSPQSAEVLVSSCASDWRQISSIPTEQFRELVRSGSFSLEKDCLEQLRKHVTDTSVTWFLDKCLNETANDEGPFPSEECESLSESFRSSIIHRYYPQFKQFQGGELNVADVSVLKDAVALQVPRLKNMSEEELKRSLEMAEEILLQDPYSRNAHRTKLIALLYQEAKFGVDVDDYQYENVLEELRTLEGPPSLSSVRNEILVTEKESELQTLATGLEQNTLSQEILDDEIAGLENQLAQSQDPKARQELLMNIQRELARKAVLEQEERKLLGQAERIENMIARLNTGNSDSLQPGPEHISFLRPLLKGDLEGLVEESQSYIDQYPESLLGYYYLAQGLWRQGDQSEALEVLRNAPMDPMKKSMLETFRQTAQDGAGKFLENLLPPQESARRP